MGVKCDVQKTFLRMSWPNFHLGALRTLGPFRDSHMYLTNTPWPSAYVAVFWSLAEDSLAWIIHILIDQYQREAGIAITADLSAVRRIDTITTLMASVRNRAWFDEWCRIADVANDIRTRRNDAVHAVWMRRGADQHTLHAKARGKVRLELKPVSITDLKKPPRPHA
jgi:hypothetical protein